MPPPGPPDASKTAPNSTKKGKKTSSAKDSDDNKSDGDAIAELFARHSKFIKQTGAIRVSDLVARLRKVGKRQYSCCLLSLGPHLPDCMADLTT